MTSFDIAAVCTVIFGLMLYFFWTKYNAFIKLVNQVSEDFSDIDIQLNRRSDLISKLIEVVKGYSKHEKDVFTEVSKARASVHTLRSMKDYEKAESAISSSFAKIIAIAEKYPELKANQSYKDLMDEMTETEDRIAQYRETYNTTVKKYNTYIQIFPNLIAANVYGFTPAEYFRYMNGDSV